ATAVNEMSPCRVEALPQGHWIPDTFGATVFRALIRFTPETTDELSPIPVIMSSPETIVLKTHHLPASEAAIAAAAACLRAGGLVAFPTETVYGLGADATNAPAIARLYQAKGRPAFNPLISHVNDLAAAEK